MIISILQVLYNSSFQDKHASLPITRAEEHKRSRLKVKEGVRLALEERQRAEEDEERARLEAEEEARLVEARNRGI